VSRNPYNNTKKRRAALAFLRSRGITQPRALYPAARHVDVQAVKTVAWNARRPIALVSR